MAVEFRAGQNAPLAAPSVRFTATAPVPVDLCALVVDTHLKVASSQDVVFYNQPHTAGVRLDGDALVVEPARLRPGAEKVLCVLGADRVTPVDTALTDGAGTLLTTFRIDPAAGETALLCWEIYRRGGDWKIRALGQGYAGGLAELFRAHGVEVDDPAPAAPSVAEVPSPGDAAPSFEWLWKIFEDSSRSAAAYLSAFEYAQHRLDDDLSAAVADPATRTGPAAEQARAQAHRRCQELLSAAETRHRDDSARLTEELHVVDAALPASLASWESPVWHAAPAPSDGIRIGDLSAPERGSLRVPLCVPLPMLRPLWIDGDDAAARQVVTALVLRLLAAHPGSQLDIIDPSGWFPELREHAAPVLAGPPVVEIGGVTPKLKGLADNAELETLAASTDGASTQREARVLVLAGLPHGYSSDDLVQVLRLTQVTGAQRISIVIAGSADTVIEDPAFRMLHENSQHLPATAEGHFADPWTGSDWHFTPDVIPAEAVAVLLQRVTAKLGAV